jgi:hypothetical protein
MRTKHQELLNAILRDDQLLTFARGTIRYTAQRDEQVKDFLGKVKLWKREIPGISAAAVSAVLSEIERRDRVE